MFIIIEFGSVKKWAAIDESNICLEQMISVARAKFPELLDLGLYFTDINKIVIEDDYLQEYIKTNKFINVELTSDLNRSDKQGEENRVIFMTSTPVVTPPNSNTASTVTDNNSVLLWDVDIDEQAVISETDQETDNNEIFTKKKISKRGENITPEEFRKLLLDRQSGIFEEYEKLGCLTTQKRKILVNITVDIMVDRYGYSIPTHIKEEFAAAIISLFPKLRDPCSPKGYEAYFNPEKHDGFLAWRLKTVVRNSPKKNKDKGQKRKREPTEEKPSCSKQPRTEDIEAAISVMKMADPNTGKDIIFSNMQQTFLYRRDNVKNILNDFPRMLDTPGLIEQDFSLMYPNKPTLAECFPAEVDKILAIYDKTVQNKLDVVLPQDETSVDAYNKDIRAIIAIQQMLPPTACGRKGGRQNSAGAINKLIVFKKTNVPMQDILESSNTQQPYLIAEGQYKSELIALHVCLDGKLISTFADATPLEAFDLLFMTHFVFNIKYDNALTAFWQFIQSFYYKIEEDVTYTPKMRELRSKLT